MNFAAFADMDLARDRPIDTIKINILGTINALILCKKDKFILSDEMSTNGTLLNGDDLTPRETYDLKDGDSIKVGSTTLLFKTAF